jgi:hypothetical protein
VPIARFRHFDRDFRWIEGGCGFLNEPRPFLLNQRLKRQNEDGFVHRFRAAGLEPNLRPFGHDLAIAHAPSHWSPRR